MDSDSVMVSIMQTRFELFSRCESAYLPRLPQPGPAGAAPIGPSDAVAAPIAATLEVSPLVAVAVIQQESISNAENPEFAAFISLMRSDAQTILGSALSTDPGVIDYVVSEVRKVYSLSNSWTTISGASDFLCRLRIISNFAEKRGKIVGA